MLNYQRVDPTIPMEFLHFCVATESQQWLREAANEGDWPYEATAAKLRLKLQRWVSSWMSQGMRVLQSLKLHR